jgi:hypothetical protein
LTEEPAHRNERIIEPGGQFGKHPTFAALEKFF